jgi:hypothetical protein
MELTILDQKFINDWQSQDFTNWKESDIREDFIAPLLRLLGYAKGTVNDILREENLKLSKPYHRIGRKQVAIDYVPTLKLKKFWIIEAKPGSPKEMSFDDYLQAHLYANHPEMQVRYIVMCNGWEIRVYDAFLSEGWDDYIHRASKDDCQETFPEIKNFLHQKTLGKALRSQILATIKESLLIEIDENEAESLKKEVVRMYYDALPRIRENAKELKMAAWEQREREDNELLSKLSFEELLELFKSPTNIAPHVSERMVKKFQDADQEGVEKLLDKVCTTYRSSVGSSVRVHMVHVLCRLMEQNIQVKSSSYTESVEASLHELVTANMKYWYFDELGNKENQVNYALCHLDNTCIRVAYKICNRSLMGPLTEILIAKKKTLSTEDFIKESPSVAQDMVGAFNMVNRLFWNKFSGGDVKQIWDIIWGLEEFEEVIDKIPMKSFPNNDGLFYRLDLYGKKLDMLSLGTWDYLSRFKERITLNPDLVNIVKLTREEVLEKMPQPLPKPEHWKKPDEALIRLMEELITKISDKRR